MTMEPQPWSITAKGGSMMTSSTRQQLIVFAFLFTLGFSEISSPLIFYYSIVKDGYEFMTNSFAQPISWALMSPSPEKRRDVPSERLLDIYC